MESPELDRIKDEASTRMAVTALVAAMTFTSGFAVPGAYNGSKPDAELAIQLNVFVICNTIAIYSSITALVILLWSQIDDPHAERNALLKARLRLLMPLAAVSVAFTAGFYMTATKVAWLAIVILVVGTVVALIILSVYLMLYLLLGYANPLVRCFTDLIFVAGYFDIGECDCWECGTGAHNHIFRWRATIICVST